MLHEDTSPADNPQDNPPGENPLATEGDMIRIKDGSDPILGNMIVCARCDSLAPRRGRITKYCVECSEEVTRIRKLKYANSRPYNPEQKKRYRENNVSRHGERGRQTSLANRWSIDDLFPEPHGMAWVRRFEVPFTYAMSKNHSASMRDGGQVFLRRETKAARLRLQEEIAVALGGANVVENKLWVEILIEKPNHRGDAINILDHAADAIKKAVHVDDRWFCVRRLDWSIVKEEPRLLIGIGQESAAPARVCSYCGRLLDYSNFTKAIHVRNGVGRQCKECRQGQDKKRKK
jgi:hypothetical protein